MNTKKLQTMLFDMGLACNELATKLDISGRPLTPEEQQLIKFVKVPAIQEAFEQVVTGFMFNKNIESSLEAFTELLTDERN